MTSSRVAHPFRSGSAELNDDPNADREYVLELAGIGCTSPARFNRNSAVGAPNPRAPWVRGNGGDPVCTVTFGTGPDDDGT